MHYRAAKTCSADRLVIGGVTMGVVLRAMLLVGVTLLATTVGLLCTYWARRASVPVVYGNCRGKLLFFLNKHCPVLSAGYRPAIWALNKHVNTVGRALLQAAPPVRYTRLVAVVHTDKGDGVLGDNIVFKIVLCLLQLQNVFNS